MRLYYFSFYFYSRFCFPCYFLAYKLCCLFRSIYVVNFYYYVVSFLCPVTSPKIYYGCFHALFSPTRIFKGCEMLAVKLASDITSEFSEVLTHRKFRPREDLRQHQNLSFLPS